MDLIQPTKTNTNSNTTPVIQLHEIETQPVLPWTQVGGAPGSRYWWRGSGFHRNDFKYSQTLSILSSRLAQGYIEAIRHSLSQLSVYEIFSFFQGCNDDIWKNKLRFMQLLDQPRYSGSWQVCYLLVRSCYLSADLIEGNNRHHISIQEKTSKTINQWKKVGGRLV